MNKEIARLKALLKKEIAQGTITGRQIEMIKERINAIKNPNYYEHY